MAFPASVPERAGQIPRPPPVFSANYGGMVFPASVPERTGQIARPSPVFPANYGGMAFPASVPERIKGLFWGESTDRMLVQGNVRRVFDRKLGIKSIRGRMLFIWFLGIASKA